MAIGMRSQYIATTEYLTEKDDRVVTLLGDIGVFSFKKIKDNHPHQVHNLGILEPASIGLAAGLAKAGFIPFFHTIAPFVVERPYEQLKVDFVYQGLNGNFVGIGGSYDDGSLGTTHYCPGDVGALKCLPGMQIVVPGTAKEMDSLIISEYDNGSPTYFRLSTASNEKDHNVEFGKACVIKTGSKATIVVVGPMLDMAMRAASDLDVTILYYTTVAPFDGETLVKLSPSRKVLLCEPYYYGALTNDVLDAFGSGYVMIEHLGVPHQIIQTYGTRAENDLHLGITERSLRDKIEKLINS